MAESKGRDKGKASQGLLLPPHLREPAGADGVAPDAVNPPAQGGPPQPAEAAPTPALPCIKAEGVCALRTTPGASFHCIFSGRGCSYLGRQGEKPGTGSERREACPACPRLDGELVERVTSGVSFPTSHISSPNEPPRWHLPDGRPVYRDALVKRWEALGRPPIVLSKTVTVVDLPRWLALDDAPIPPRVKWGTWRLDLAELARVVDFLSERDGPVAAPPGNEAAKGGAH